MKLVLVNLKKTLLSISVLLVTLFCCAPTFAKNNVSNISIDVAIHNNGSATITQMWQGTFNEGTEVYIPIEDKNLFVRNFKVYKNGREYLDVEDWDVNWSFEVKKWRSGIHRTSKGVELCFGISEYGENTYTFSYDIDPLVRAYTDSDGFNFQFINPGMDIFPTDVTLRIRVDDDKKLSTDNARIWGFGYNGMATFSEEGYAVAYTTSPLRGSHSLIITLQIYKGLIAPNVEIKDTFENIILNEALTDSSHEEVLRNKQSGISLAQIILYGFIFFVIAKIVASKIRKNNLKKFYKDVAYFRDNPNGGDIALSYSLYKDFDIWRNKDTNVIGAIIMKMINAGNLIPIQDKSYGFFGKEKVSTSLKVGPEPEDEFLNNLYSIIIKAAGPDGILQENELKNYASRNYKTLTSYLESIDSRGRSSLHSKGGYSKIYGKNLKDLTDIGKNELAEVYGLRKFLDEFTLISERSLTEGVIWEDLIVYATLFGIGKKVLSELKELYPDKIVEIERYSDTLYVSDTYFRLLYYNTVNARRVATAAKMAEMAAKGLGGMASLSGGGGFSGGGSGGGTR